MGRSVNKVTLLGTLGRDPELRQMPNGNPVVNLSLATDESYTDKQTGQKVEQTEWHRVTVYGKLAEIASQYLKKGSKAYFEGKLRTRDWEKDGVKRYTTEIIANDMLMLDSHNDSMGAPAGAYQPAGQMMNQGQAPMAGMNQAPQPQGGYQQQAPQQAAPAAQPMNQSNGYQQPGMAPQAAPQQRTAQAPQQPAQQGGYQQAPQQQAPQAAPQPSNSFDFDDDVPF